MLILIVTSLLKIFRSFYFPFLFGFVSFVVVVVVVVVFFFNSPQRL